MAAAAWPGRRSGLLAPPPSLGDLHRCHTFPPVSLRVVLFMLGGLCPAIITLSAVCSALQSIATIVCMEADYTGITKQHLFFFARCPCMHTDVHAIQHALKGHPGIDSCVHSTDCLQLGTAVNKYSQICEYACSSGL